MQDIEPIYLKPLRNSVSNTITADIPTILAYLFDNYGVIEDEEQTDREQSVQAMLYDLCDPVVTVFTALEDLQELATAAGNEYTDRQLVKFGVEIIKNTGDFETGLTEWNAKTLTDKTWLHFKSHFTAAYKNLRATRGKTMRSAGYHQANMLASQVLTEVKSVQEAVLQALQTHSLERNDEHVPPAEHSANSMSAGEEIQLEMLKAIKELRSEMNSLKQASKKNTYNKTKNRTRFQMDKYC